MQSVTLTLYCQVWLPKLDNVTLLTIAGFHKVLYHKQSLFTDIYKADYYIMLLWPNFSDLPAYTRQLALCHMCHAIGSLIAQ